jgi:hypothetical protein
LICFFIQKVKVLSGAILILNPWFFLDMLLYSKSESAIRCYSNSQSMVLYSKRFSCYYSGALRCQSHSQSFNKIRIPNLESIILQQTQIYSVSFSSWNWTTGFLAYQMFITCLFILGCLFVLQFSMHCTTHIFVINN